METIITVASGRAFGASSSQWGYTACVSSDPTDGITVYDAVAGHYTACHALTPRQVARLRRLAARDSDTEGGQS